MFYIFSAFVDCSVSGVEFSSDGKMIISTPSLLEDFEVPKEVEVINGGNSALQSSFIKCAKSIKTITFQTGSQLTTIFPYVFSGTTLRSINMSPCSKLKILSEGLFYGCSKLQTIVLPEGLETISIKSLQFLVSSNKITIPDTVKTIEGDAYGGGALISSFKEITITSNSVLETIGQSAFSNSKITSFYIPKNLASIRGAFQGSKITKFTVHPENKNFKFKDGFLLSYNNSIIWHIVATTGDVVIPSYVNKLEYYAGNKNPMRSVSFEGPIEKWEIGHTFSQTNLVSIDLPSGMEDIPWAAFFGCKELETVTFSKDIKRILASAFNGCVKLKSISINDGITLIGDSAFFQCTSLKKFVCPKELRNFGEGVFSQCTGLEFVSNGNPKFSVHENILYSDENFAREYFGEGGHITIKESCQRISDAIFVGKKITTIDIKSNVALTVGKLAFSNTDLKTVVFPECLTSIGNEAFSLCSKLEEITFNKNSNLESIPEKCFFTCPLLHKIVLPTKLASIGEYAFYSDKLTTNNLQETSIASIGKLAFAYTSIESLTLPAALSSVGDEAFRGTKLTTVVMQENSMGVIMPLVFKDCESLNSFTFSNSIENISSFAFSRCIKLRTIALPNKINIIMPNAFEYCSLLESISIPLNSKLEIKGQAFFNCISLVRLDVSKDDTVFSFANGILMNKDRTKIVLFLPTSKKTIYVVPSKVVEIGNYAFQDCKNLRTIIIPEGDINSVGYQAFDGCTSLSSLYMAHTLTIFGNHAFDRCPKLSQCGSVVYELEDKTNAINAGIPKIAFETNCPNIEKSISCHNTPFTTLFLVTLVL